MADGYLEDRQREYEARREAFMRRKRHLPPLSRKPQQPDDEAL